jgi:hypothetical protein
MWQTDSRVAPRTCSLGGGLLEKSKLAQHGYEGAHKEDLDETRILEIESNSRYKKCKELTHTACLINPIGQPSLEMYPVCIPLISREAGKLYGKSV